MVARRPQQDGLPPGWTLQLKQMRSGRTIRYFMNSQTGQKFSSEEDLVHHVKMTSTLNSQNEDRSSNKRCMERHSENMDIQVVKKTNEEWLPDGWEVQTKTRKSGSRSGTKYKCYIDPSTGSKFYSKPEVFRYLEKLNHKSCLSNQKKAGSVVHSAGKVVIEKSEVMDLPPGWIKELKLRRVANRVRKDPYYANPVTAYVLRSKKDVLHYVETGKISKHAFQLQKRHTSDLELTDDKTSASCAAKRPKLQHPASRLRPFGGKQSSDTSGLAVPETEASNKMLCRRGSVGTRSHIAPIAETLSGKASMEKQNDYYERPTNYETVSTPAYDLKGKGFLDSGMGKCSSSNNNSSKSSQMKWLNLPRRSSKRLAELHSKLPKIEFLETNQQDRTPTGDRAVSNSPSELLRKNSLEWGMEKSSSRSWNNSGKSNQKGGFVLPCRSSKRLSGLKTVLPKITETNQQKSASSDDKAVFNSAADLRGKNSLESEMLKSKNRSGKNNSGKSNKKEELDLPRACRSSKRLAGFKTALPKVESSETNQQEIPLSGNKAVLNFEAELIRKNPLEKGMEKSNSKRSGNNSGKSNKNRLEVPQRSSKRLAGLKACMSEELSSSELVIQNAVMESENEVVPALADEASGPCEARPITELAQHAFSVESIPSIGELLNKSQNSLDDQVVPTEQFQTLETEKSSYEKSLRFADPCLDFAFKTLTGVMPLEDAVANITISTYTADILHEKGLHNSKMQKSCNKKFWTDVGGNKYKKELKLPCSSMKQTAELENELVGSSGLQVSVGRSCETEPNLDFCVALDNFPSVSSQKLSGPEMGLAHHDSPHPNFSLNEEPSKSKQINKDQNVALAEPRSFGFGKINGDKPVSELSFPSADYWSDPCLEFAFKTLTGAIPLDDNFAMPDYPQPQLDSLYKQRDGNLALPDFGIPSHFQSDISSQCDASGRLPLSPSVPPSSGNKSLPSCGAVGAQQPLMEQNKDIQGKVRS